MDPIWKQSYQPGVPASIDPDTYSSLNEFFVDSITKYNEKLAFTNMGCQITYADLDSMSLAFAAFLQNELKLEKGERVAIMLPNVLQYPVAMLGVLRAGCVVVNVNPLYTPDEVEHQLRDAEVSAILVLENFARTVELAVQKVAVKHIIVTKVSDVFAMPKSILVDFVVKYIKRMVPHYHFEKYIKYSNVLKVGAKLQYTKPDVTNADLAFLQYTGGTTGKAKGAMLTHRNIIANIMQAAAWFDPILKHGEEVVITALPLYHIFSLMANCFTMLHFGAFNVLITNPRDTKSFIADLKKYPFTVITGVNTLYNLLLNQTDFADVDFSKLKIALGSGMAVQKAVAEKWQKVTGTPLLEAYGLTEASPAVCVNPTDLKEYNGTVGLPISSTNISVRDENGNELPLNEVGELWISGPQVMQGYWQNKQETQNVLSEDGWLYSGDIVRVDDKGYVHIVDRKKDMIIVSGFNVYPNEIEDVIAMMPGVDEVAVIGIPDKAHGEIIKAFIVRKDFRMTSSDVVKFCSEHLTNYKIPKQVEFRESLPKTNVGKILRRALR